MVGADSPSRAGRAAAGRRVRAIECKRPGAVEGVGEPSRLRLRSAPRRRNSTSAPSSAARAETIRPATISSRPSPTSRAMRAGRPRARCGGGGRPTTAAHGAGSAAAARASRLCHSAWLCGRRLSTAARQPTSRAAPAQPAPQRRADRRAEQLLGFDRRGREIGMRTGHQAAPRQSDDPAAMAGRVERQHQVDHGQAGADQQRRSPRLGELARRPPGPPRPTGCG